MAHKVKLVPGVGPVQDTTKRGPRQDNKNAPGYDVRAKLREVLDNPTSSPQARASAGRTLAEMDGLIGRHQAAPDRGAVTPLGQLSRADLESELHRLRRKCGLSD